MDSKKLQKANIPQAWQDDCFISADGLIFTPQFGEDGTMVKTGEQVYVEWLANKGNAATPQPTSQQTFNASVMVQLAKLKVGVK